VGLVKFDFLGLRTLTVIESAVRMINVGRVAAAEAPLDLQRIPMDDPRAFSLLQAGDTHAVFQLESSGMRDLIKRLRPDCFDDIVALVALYRPGPLQSGMVDTFIQRKHADGAADIDYLHPSLEPVLKGTYGVILYQEQVMQAAQVLAGYSLGQADLLRRAMGKKIAAEMQQQREIFMSGAVANGVAEELARHIFDLMEKFAEYGFNKSHSVAYALLAYQTAWLKAHYPAEFMAAVFSADMEYTDKLALHYRDCRQLGLQLQQPNVNASGTAFTAADERSIRYGLGALKGLGRAAADAIVAERAAHGPYVDLFDLCSRIDTTKVNKRALESLVKSGALDELGENRPSLLADLPLALGSAEQYARARAAGQDDMFGELAPPPPPERGPIQPRWSPVKLYMHEYESLGFFLSGHPFDQYRDDVAYLATGSIGGVIRSMPRPDPDVAAWKNSREVTLAGLITDFRKRGNRVSMYLDDGRDRVELALYAEQYQAFRHLLDERSIRVVTGKLRYESFIDGWRLSVKTVQDIDRLIEQRARGLEIHWLADNRSGLNADTLRELLSPYRPGRCPVAVVYTCRDAQARLNLGDEWRVRPSAELRERLAEAVGMQAFRFDYQESVLGG
jgi:DNA polymerase-3 subunit alpha